MKKSVKDLNLFQHLQFFLWSIETLGFNFWASEVALPPKWSIIFDPKLSNISVNPSPNFAEPVPKLISCLLENYIPSVLKLYPKSLLFPTRYMHSRGMFYSMALFI